MATAAQKQNELQALRDERAQVESELARIKGRSVAPVATKITGQPATVYVAPARTDSKKVVLVVAAVALAFWLWKRKR